MIDFVRIGVRIAAAAAIIAIAVGVYALFNEVKIPAGDTALIVEGLGKGKAILEHWAPEFYWIFTALVTLYFVRWSVFFLRYAVMGIKWIMVIWR